MDSTHKNDTDDQVMARGKAIPAPESKQIDGKDDPIVEKKADTSRVTRDYDEGHLFYLFCSVYGRMPDLIKLVESFGPRERERFPKPSTLYKIAEGNDWRRRYEELRTKIREDFESHNGMPYTKIDQLASYFLQGTLMRVAEALKKGDYSGFNLPGLKAIWSMQRVERGLADSIPYRDQNHNLYQENLRQVDARQQYKDSTAGTGFYERLEGLDSADIKKFARVFLGEDLDDNRSIPSIIKKR